MRLKATRTVFGPEASTRFGRSLGPVVTVREWCGYEMSRNTLSKSGGPHHVGSKDRVSRALAELVKAGRLRQDGNGYRPVTP